MRTLVVPQDTGQHSPQPHVPKPHLLCRYEVMDQRHDDHQRYRCRVATRKDIYRSKGRNGIQQPGEPGRAHQLDDTDPDKGKE